MTGLRTTIYKVSDLSAGKEWFARAFETRPYFDEVFYVGFNIGGYELGLLEDAQASDDKGDNVMAYWAAPDVADALSKLIALGATMHQPATNVGGDIIVGSVRDPWGNVLGMIYNPEFMLPAD